jgi:hypothetical protein
MSTWMISADGRTAPFVRQPCRSCYRPDQVFLDAASDDQERTVRQRSLQLQASSGGAVIQLSTSSGCSGSAVFGAVAASPWPRRAVGPEEVDRGARTSAAGPLTHDDEVVGAKACPPAAVVTALPYAAQRLQAKRKRP